jgi:hypothetical protein
MSELADLEKKLRENSQALSNKPLVEFNAKFAEELRSNLTPKPGQTPEQLDELALIAAELKAGTSLIDVINAPFKPKPKPKEAPEP